MLLAHRPDLTTGMPDELAGGIEIFFESIRARRADAYRDLERFFTCREYRDTMARMDILLRGPSAESDNDGTRRASGSIARVAGRAIRKACDRVCGESKRMGPAAGALIAGLQTEAEAPLPKVLRDLSRFCTPSTIETLRTRSMRGAP